MSYQVRMTVGPAWVQQWRDRISTLPACAGVTAGTEHVYFTIEAADPDDARARLRALFGNNVESRYGYAAILT